MILMSTDPVALDSVIARLVYLKPEMVPTNYHGEKMGLGHCREENIEIVVADAMHSKQPVSMEDLVCWYGKPDFNGTALRYAAISGQTSQSPEYFPEEFYIEPDKMYSLRYLRKQLPCSW